MAARVTQIEKDLMWELYKQGYSIGTIADTMGRGRSTVSRYVREREVAINMARVVMDAQKTQTEVVLL